MRSKLLDEQSMMRLRLQLTLRQQSSMQRWLRLPRLPRKLQLTQIDELMLPRQLQLVKPHLMQFQRRLQSHRK
jgi:hypothetical protein